MTPESDDAWNRADTLLNLGRPNEALELLGPAIAADPGNPWLHGTLARALLELERVDEAVLSAQDALACDPTNAWAYRLLSLGLMGQDAKYARSALADPRRKMGAHEAALAAVRYEPRSPESFIVLAQAAARNRAYEQAVGAARHATELAPESAEAHDSVAYVALAMREFERAEDAAREALARDPQCATAQYHLAVALHYTGRPREATDVLRDAARVHPTSFGDRLTAYVKARRQHALLLVVGLAMVAASVAAGAAVIAPLIVVAYVGIGAVVSADRRRSSRESGQGR